MPPCRRLAGNRGTYGQLSDPYETLESRIKRLRGNDIEPGTDADPLSEPPPGTAVLRPAPSPPPQTMTRADVPNVRNLRRGSAAVAESALQHEGIQVLIEELVDDRHAKTSKGPIASYKKTWTKFHVSIYGCRVPTVPLSVDSIVAVASLFKRGGYRGFGNYLSAMKSLHIESNHPWSDLLSHTVTWVTRSVERGIGPARQSCSFDFQSLARLNRIQNP